MPDDLFAAQLYATRQERIARKRADKLPWVRFEYEQRKCHFPGCETFPNFGFGQPFSREPVWTCRDHRKWFEAKTLAVKSQP